jgi:hypothetical protein
MAFTVGAMIRDRFAFQQRRQHRGGAVGAHAAGIGAGIAIADALVVLRRAERHDGVAVGQRERSWLPRLRGIPRSPLRRRRNRTAREDLAHRASASAMVIATVTPLPAASPSALITTGMPKRPARHAPRPRGHAFIAGGRDTGALAQVLGEALAAFELRRRLAWAEHREARAAQAVGQPIDQRRFGPDHDEADAAPPRRRSSRGVIGRRRAQPESHARRSPDCPARRTASCSSGGLRQLPCQRMFAPARSQKQDIHGRPFLPDSDDDNPAGLVAKDMRRGQRCPAFRQRDFRAAQAHGRGPLRLRAGARRAFGREARGFGPLLPAPQGRECAA